MSDESVHADLKFQDSDKKEETQMSDKCGGKGSSPASHSQRKTVMILSLLCLLRFIGVVIIGGIFYTSSETEMIKSNQLQSFKEELQRNVSLQQMYNLNNTKEVKNLAAMLQNIATQLCRELYSKDPEHKCKPCPKGSQWYKDTCYSEVSGYATWQQSVMFCSSQNASLLKVKNKDVLEFIRSKMLSNYWLALSPRKDDINYETLSEKMFFSEWFEGSTYDLNTMFCGYIDGVYVYYTECTDLNRIICENPASKVQVESVLNGFADGSL
ncbi:C-type lectin domain family 12 member A-like [Grammomys surdaster]|uniref:C-type lectin domain family 12 member A-like n=1 Tax=Grammomys surdaster TaxID=491861 RepID=UPI0010A08569|nr:C-type lectin domain family 12 member A-like [Grammomys surdaster]